MIFTTELLESSVLREKLGRRLNTLDSSIDGAIYTGYTERRRVIVCHYSDHRGVHRGWFTTAVHVLSYIQSIIQELLFSNLFIQLPTFD